MARKNWDPDDFLDFDYGRPVPRNSESVHEDRSSSNSSSSSRQSDEMRLYEELRHKNDDKASGLSRPGAAVSEEREPKKPQADKSAARRPQTDMTAVKRPQADMSAVKKAQQEAFERYRSNYKKNNRKRPNRFLRAKIGHKILSIVYLMALLVFAASLTIMDVLPARVLFMIYGILALLSLIVVMLLRKDNIRRWVRSFASLIALCLIAVYGVGSAYAVGTLSFLNFTSVQNDNKVSSITKEPFNVVITGIDVKGKIDKQGRSDVNMIVTVNPQTETILLTSIPRDYQIYMPDKDFALDKLTHTGFYSVESTILAEEDLLDTKINYYVKVNFSTVEKFIDAIGGIDVESEYEFTPVKLKSWTVKKGMNHMNGKQALAFARERKAFLTGDNQRIKNQQAVFEAMINKATSSKTMLLSYNKVISSLKDYFQMSFSSGEFRSLIKLQIAKNPEWKIYKNTIVGGNGMMGTYTTGSAQAYVMTQDEYSINNAKALIQAVLEGKTLDKDEDGNPVIVETGEGESQEGEN